MNTELQEIIIDGLGIMYRDTGGKGRPILFIHGFAESSYTWLHMWRQLPPGYRMVGIDLKGFGHSDKTNDGMFAPYDQAKIVIELVKQLDLENFILVGHSFGGLVSLFCIFLRKLNKRIDKLILVDSAGYFQQLPWFIAQLRDSFTGQLAMRHFHPKVLTRLIMDQVYYDKSLITDDLVNEYSTILTIPGAKECLVECAQQITTGNPNTLSRRLKKLSLPTLIIWGQEDKIIEVSDAHRFHEDIPDSHLAVIPGCGHSPHEELPTETAKLIQAFISGEKLPETIDAVTSRPLSPPGLPKLKMRKLVDKWSPAVTFLFVVVKFLQFLKLLGIKTRQGGWRNAASAYLRAEHSKFSLAVFNLAYGADVPSPAAQPSFQQAREHLIKRLGAFLRDTRACHWRLQWSRNWAVRKKLNYIDIIHGEFYPDSNNLKKITIYLDPKRNTFKHLTEEHRELICKIMVKTYNEVLDVNEKRRPYLLKKQLRKWLEREKSIPWKAFLEGLFFIRRILSGTYIHFEELPGDAEESVRRKFSTPDFYHRKHPGWGLINILCRFDAKFTEADLWFQFQHVPVDGLPMQEILDKLKSNWGISRKLCYPALDEHSKEITRLGSANTFLSASYHGQLFFDSANLLETRKKLNRKYLAEFGDPVTTVSMLMWALCRHKCFRNCKFAFPIDLAECLRTGRERTLGMMFIRPSVYFSPHAPLKGFIAFQREFSRRLRETRERRSESFELLELYALTSPWLYLFTSKLFPEALGEFVGTVGLTMLKDSELFLTPLSDISTGGFMAFGNLRVPTVDGKYAGMVSVRGTHAQVEQYLKAIQAVTSDFQSYL